MTRFDTSAASRSDLSPPQRSSLAATAAARTQASSASPIVIGWAFDSKGAMAPFDGPALAAAQVRVKQINAKGGVGGRPLQINTCDTQGNKPAIAKACATKLIGQGANVMFTTCDVDFAAPVVQESINRGMLTVAPCIGTDQMGPKRFGAKGKLAFSFGNVAQDEGSAMAQFAWNKGWRTAAIATDTVIVYFKNVTAAFAARFKQLGGKIVDEETYQSLGSNERARTPSAALNGVKADVIVTSTAGAFGALLDARLRAAVARQQHADPQLVGRRRHVLAAEGPEGDELLLRHVRATRSAAIRTRPSTSSRSRSRPAPAASSPARPRSTASSTAINRSHGSTNGATLAATMEKFKKVPTLSGLVSFSRDAALGLRPVSTA